MNLFVTKLNFSTTEESLKARFEEYGEVASITIVMDRDTGRSKCYGFVEMASDYGGFKSIENLHEAEVDGRTIIVKEAKPPEDKERRKRFEERREDNDEKPKSFKGRERTHRQDMRRNDREHREKSRNDRD
jgi:RNA recognition motif-containing protein